MTTSAPAWHAEARRLFEAGVLLSEIAKRVGHNTTMIRWALDIGNERQKQRERVREHHRRDRSKERAAVSGVRQRPTGRKDRRADHDRRSVQAAYADQPESRGISLPALALGTLGAEEDPRPVARLAPKTRLGSPGADRWREIHRRMIRDGKIPEPGLVEDLHH